jgi:CubicO group peptidase (beta-lactamase class C family)
MPSCRVAPLLAFILTAAPATPALHAQPSREALIRTLDSLVAGPVAAGRTVGASVAVIRGTDTLLLRGYGRAELEWDVPTPPDAVYAIGSVTKQFTAAAILQLRDEGKLDLDADITTWLPDFPTQGHRVTVRQLLDHTSGIRGLTEIPEFRTLYVSDLPRDSAVALIARQRFDFVPGEAMIYNNSGYFLLGLIIEKASGMSYEEYLAQRIFAPLGMTSSRYCDQLAITPRRAHGYQLGPAGARRAPYFHYKWPYSAGALCSTAGDLVRWLQGLHGGQVLSAQSYREMTSPSRLGDGTPLRYGMGVSVGPDANGHRLVAHGGAIEGYLAWAGWYPDADLTIVVLLNSQGAVSPAALAAALAAAVLPPPAAPRPVRAFAGDVSPLPGTYAGPSRGREMVAVVTSTENGLAMSVNGGAAAPMTWVEGLTFRVNTNLITFEMAPGESQAVLVRFDQGSGYYKLRRRP